MQNAVSTQTPWQRAPRSSWRRTTEPCRRLTGASPRAAPVRELCGPQAAASSPCAGRPAPAPNYRQPARPALLRSLTIFAGGFAKLLYVGLSQVPELLHPPRHTGTCGRHGHNGRARPSHVTAPARGHLTPGAGGARAPSSRAVWAGTPAPGPGLSWRAEVATAYFLPLGLPPPSPPPERLACVRGGHDVRARLSPTPSSKPIGSCPRPQFIQWEASSLRGGARGGAGGRDLAVGGWR